MLALAALPLLTGACWINRPITPPPRTSTPDRITQYYEGTRDKRVEQSVLRWSDGVVESHGLERRYARDGTLVSECFYEHGVPRDVMRTWYPDGTPKSEVDFADGATLAPMTFWHANGRLAGQGQGIAGVKEGPWTMWHENGRMAARGAYHRAQRIGVWEEWTEGGQLLGGADASRSGAAEPDDDEPSDAPWDGARDSL